MNKRLIKIIKQTDRGSKPPPVKKSKPKKKRTIEATIQDWITERRENVDTEDRLRSSQFATFSDNSVPAEAV